MTYSDSSDAFPKPEQDPSQARAVQAGLAALKQKDYATAIAALEACQTSPDPATRLKAQMGLIKAYSRTAQIDAALQLCRPLTQHDNPQVKAWAQQTLTELTPASRSDAVPKTVPDAAPPPEPTADPTGFVPRSIRSNAADRTGFVPLNQPAAADSASQPAAQAATPQTAKPPQITKSPQTAKLPRQPQPPTPTQPVVPAAPAAPIPPPDALAASRWRNAGRSPRWSSLGKVDASGLWALQVGSMVLLFWIIKFGVQLFCESWNAVSIRLNWLTGLRRVILPTDLTWPIVILLAILVIASPWLLGWLLRRVYRRQPLSLTQLEHHSPEAVRLLRRVCVQRRHPIPILGLLPEPAPLLFTYGYLPGRAQIVLSQGLLDQLADDEIAALFAAELAHLRYWDFGVTSAITLIMQLPYQLYWQVASWGDRQHDRVLKTVAAAVSSLGYGLFWLLRLAGLWLSRVRLYYSDRMAADLTGNPNGLTRALLKTSLGMAQSIQQQQQTGALLESFELLLPVSYRNAVTAGSLYTGDAEIFAWDRRSPYRRWLILNNTHPTLGERLDLLMQYAEQWRLQPELTWQHRSGPISLNRRRLLLQGAPFFGIPIGLGVALLLWGFGLLARQLRWFELAWLAGDRSVLIACCLLGFSIGMFLRINAFFPDLKPSQLLTDPALANLLVDPEALPVDSQVIQMQGTLLGRKGFLNWLYRDLMLQTASGTIRLHYTSHLGWIGDLFPKALRPPSLVGRPVTVTGWFRRGATPWIDVETIQSQYGRVTRGHHPIWSTILATAAAVWAVYLIFQGG